MTLVGHLPVAHNGFNSRRLGTKLASAAGASVIIGEVDEWWISWIESPEATSTSKTMFHTARGGSSTYGCPFAIKELESEGGNNSAQNLKNEARSNAKKR
jgi:hypothetical protein